MTLLSSAECPTSDSELDIGTCGSSSVGIGDLCEGDGECGTSDDADNCGSYDMYRKVDPSGGGGVTLSGLSQGTCYVSGNCFGTGSSSGYNDNEQCTFTTPISGSLQVSRFSTESCCDKLNVGSTAYKGSAGPSSVIVSSGQSFTWSADGSTTSTGFEICIQPSIPNTCTAGTYLSGSNCQVCPANKYSVDGAFSCTNCPSGKVRRNSPL